MFVEALTNDLSAATGLPYNNIQISNIQANNINNQGGTQATILLPANTLQDQTNIQTILNNLNNGTIQLTTINSLPLQSRINSNQQQLTTVLDTTDTATNTQQHKSNANNNIYSSYYSIILSLIVAIISSIVYNNNI